MPWGILKRNKKSKRPAQEQAHDMAWFFDQARREVDMLIARDQYWYSTLPYHGNMSSSQAREFEIEKRAIWRRVIYDARRSRLNGLRWVTRQDNLVCEGCLEMEGRVFNQDQMAELEEKIPHLGCRCELTPVK